MVNFVEHLLGTRLIGKSQATDNRAWIVFPGTLYLRQLPPIEQ
jgi:hypothetical protein